MTQALTNDGEQEISDLLLVNQAQQGSRLAFKSLYERHYRRVFALCYRLSGQTHMAEEITQDCFVRVWQKLPQFRGDSQFTTWLHSLAVNQALNSVKQHKRFWARFLPIDNKSNLDAEEQHAHGMNEYQGLDKLIVKLPERARIIFVLYALEGYQHDEIGQMLGIADGTSKAQYHRARNLLQEMLS